MRGAGFWQRHALARGSILGELRSFVGHCSLRGVSMAAQQGERSKVAMPNDIAYSRKLGPLTPLVGEWEGDDGVDLSYHNQDDWKRSEEGRVGKECVSKCRSRGEGEN